LPHTSNFDFFIGFIYSRAFAIPFPNFLAKDSAFRGWIGKLGRKVGGIPVNRSERTNFVDQVAAEFQKRDRMILAITPEGTRSRTDYWKSGFYHMAMKANVPVIMAYIDYARKYIACGDVAEITGDMDADIAKIRAYFASVTPRHPERHGEIRFRPASDEKPDRA
jgi:1-acyl-sn-glycerol-3-phosphate acyltransferase